MRVVARPGPRRGRTGGPVDDQRRDRAGRRRLRSPRHRARREAGRAAGGAADGHPRRPRYLDARHHQGHPRVARAGGGVRRARRRARGERRDLHSLREPYRGDGARYQSGRGDDKADEKTGKAAKHDAADSANAMTRKQVNDAAAYIRSLAQMRDRNADWAERAVREAVSLPAREALKSKVIDLVAEDVPDLLKRLDGRRLQIAEKERVLQTSGVVATAFEPDWRTRFLSVITDPSIAYILILVGIYALVFEFSNPGLVFPGVVGAICILIALYAFHLLPVNYAGLALMLVGIAFMVAELFFPAFGSFGIGWAILIDTDIPGYGVPLPLALGVAAASAAFLFLVVGMLVRGRKRPVVSGREEMIGSPGEMLEDCEREGWARVGSETWRIRSAAPLKRGQRVRVASIEGLVLDVVPES